MRRRVQTEPAAELRQGVAADLAVVVVVEEIEVVRHAAGAAAGAVRLQENPLVRVRAGCARVDVTNAFRVTEQPPEVVADRSAAGQLQARVERRTAEAVNLA